MKVRSEPRATRGHRAARRGRGTAVTSGATATGVSSAPDRFAERARKVRRRPWVVLASLLLLAAVIAGGAWALTSSQWFRVERIEVTGAQPDRETSIRDQLHGTLGKPLVEVNTSEAAGQVASTLLYSRVDVTRAWPDGLLVDVEERTPAAVARAGDGSFTLIDREGIAYERVPSPPPNMPVADLEEPGDQTSRATVAAVGLALPSAMSTRMENFAVDAKGNASFEISGVEVIWGDGSDSAIKAAVLEPLLSRGGVSRIDVTAPMNPVTTE